MAARALALMLLAGVPVAARAEMVSASLVDTVAPAGAAQDAQRQNETHPDRRAYRLSWGVRAIGADRLHNLGITGKGVTVAVIDSGRAGASSGLAHSISNASIDIIPARKSGSARAARSRHPFPLPASRPAIFPLP